MGENKVSNEIRIYDLKYGHWINNLQHVITLPESRYLPSLTLLNDDSKLHILGRLRIRNHNHPTHTKHWCIDMKGLMSNVRWLKTKSCRDKTTLCE